MANNWFLLLDGSTPAWVTSNVSGSVEQDLTCSFDVTDVFGDTDAYAWATRLDGTSNVWFQLQVPITTLGTAQADLSPSYKVLYPVYSNSASVTYQVNSSLGFISGQVMLPYGSVEADYTSTYSFLFEPVTQDYTDVYRVLNSAELDLGEYYNVKGGVEQDLVATYQSGGYAQADLEEVSRLWQGVEKDLAGQYSVQNVITQDSAQVTFNIVTTPLSAGDNRTFTYQVYSSVSQDISFVNRLLNSAERDVTDTWNIQLYAERDLSPVWDGSGQVLEDKEIIYTIQGIIVIDADLFARYNVAAKTKQVPNVIGLPLPKAKKLLEDSGFVLGNITYN